MATKKKASRKVTVIFNLYCPPVEFEADSFALLGQESQNPVYAITREDPASNVFIEFGQVLAIGFSEDMKNLAKAVETNRK